MKISELIDQLTEILEKKGDYDVCTSFGDYTISVDKISVDDIFKNVLI